MKGFACSLRFIIVTGLIQSGFAYSKDADIEYKNMLQMMESIKLEKKEVESMVNKLAESGRITYEEASNAKREIASLKDSDLENIKQQAIVDVKNQRSLEK